MRQRGVETRIYNYPGSGHALLPVEHGCDATFNISFWMDKYLVAPFEEQEADNVEEAKATAEEEVKQE